MLQQTNEWLDFRRGKLSASKAPVILGASPYATPYQLFEEELGLRETQKSTPYMQKGLDCEAEARDWFLMETGIHVSPSVEVHPDNPLFIASLDGISEKRDTIVEIKNNNKNFHDMAHSGKIPDFHFIQLQHQMYVTGMKESHYLSWRKDDPLFLRIARDDDFIADMIAKELEFKKCIDDLVPPPLTDRDYCDLSHDLVLSEVYRQYELNKRLQKEYEAKAESFKTQMLTIAGDRNVKGSGFMMTRYMTKGRVDYDKLITNHCPNVDVDIYRKDPTISYRITNRK
jgi:putative phage-type endonuclease